MIKITSVDDISIGEHIYISPIGNASKKLYKLLRDKRPDIGVLAFLDSYKQGEYLGIAVKKIDTVRGDQSSVIIALERQDMRQQIAGNLQNVGFNNVKWTDGNLIANRSKKDETINKNDILYFFYDLSVNALNYEYACSIYHAEIERRKVNVN